MRLLAASVVLLVVAALGLMFYGTGAGDRREALIRQLPSLEGAAGPSEDAARIRVVVADIDWAMQRSGPGFVWPGLQRYQQMVQAICNEVRLTQADLVILYGVLFRGTRAHGVAAAERIAEASGLLWRVESSTWDRRWSMLPLWPPGAQVGQVSAGHVVLSRFPIERATWTPEPPRGPWSSRLWGGGGGITRVVVETGPSLRTVLEVVDRPAATVALDAPDHGGFRVGRGAAVAGPASSSLATDHLLLTWSDASSEALLMRNTSHFHDTLIRPVLLAEFRMLAVTQREGPPAEPPQPGPTPESGDGTTGLRE
jgi:hypothetical protein